MRLSRARASLRRRRSAEGARPKAVDKQKRPVLEPGAQRQRAEMVSPPRPIVKTARGGRCCHGDPAVRAVVYIPPRLRGGQGGALSCSLRGPTRPRFARPLPEDGEGLRLHLSQAQSTPSSSELFRGLFGDLRRHDLFHRAAPAGMGEVEHDAVRSLELDLVEGVRVAVLAPREVGAAGLLDR
jgi:hypothetical protein